jgi:uncharacterized protein YjbI with pentapeptide repeats
VGADRRRFAYRQASLQGANLFGTDLRRAKFAGVILADADFRGADVRGVDFRHLEAPLGGFSPVAPSGIDRADFGGALADRFTQWPQGFNWRAAGVRMM